MIPHSEDPIQVTQYVANFFVRLGLVLVYLKWYKLIRAENVKKKKVLRVSEYV